MFNNVQHQPPKRPPAFSSSRDGARPAVKTAVPFSAGKSRPGSFNDLPNEIVCGIASHVFHAAVTDQSNDVSSLVCNAALQSTLGDELHANAVLRKIHEARNFVEMCKALEPVQGVFPHYRQGCLIAAIHLLPKLGFAPQAPALLWSRLRALMPSQTAPLNDDGTDPREAVVQAMVDSFGRPGLGFHSFMTLPDALALLGADSKVSPRLEAGLMRWAYDQLFTPGFSTKYCSELGDKLMSSAPAALQPRLARTFDFLKRFHADASEPDLQAMARQMKQMEESLAAGDPDQRWQLRLLARAWAMRSRHSLQCSELYRAFFSRLDPERQVWLISLRQSPMTPQEIAPFLGALIGKVPEAALLKAQARYSVYELSARDVAVCAKVVQDIVLASMRKPRGKEVLQAALTYQNIRYLGLRPMIQRCIAQTDEEHRLALTLRMDLEDVGCGEYDSGLVARRSAISAQIDGLLNERPIKPLALIAIVDMSVTWLDENQKSRLIEQLRYLPPVDRARCLSRMFTKLGHARLTVKWPSPDVILGAFEGLPMEHRAGPVAALLGGLDTARSAAHATLLQGAKRLYDELPTALRPVATMKVREVIQMARDQAPG